MPPKKVHFNANIDVKYIPPQGKGRKVPQEEDLFLHLLHYLVLLHYYHLHLDLQDRDLLGDMQV